MYALVFYLIPTLGPTELASSIALRDLVSIQRDFRRSRVNPVAQGNGRLGPRKFRASKDEEEPPVYKAWLN